MCTLRVHTTGDGLLTLGLSEGFTYSSGSMAIGLGLGKDFIDWLNNKNVEYCSDFSVPKTKLPRYCFRTITFANFVDAMDFFLRWDGQPCPK